MTPFKRYRGERYKHQANPLLVEAYESGWVHSLDFAGVLEFYGELLPDVIPNLTEADQAYMGCCDRYYLLVGILDRADALHPWLYARCREIEAAPDGYLDLWARDHYKSLRLDEPVPVPGGWKAHGDLIPGDFVFGPDGQPARVVATSEIFTDADAYRLTFDDGTTIEASGDHLWTVERLTRKRAGKGRVYREEATIATREIAGMGMRPDRRLAIRVNQPIQMPAAILPVEPYTFGAWLGDGHSAGNRVTCADLCVFDRIEAEGYRTSHNQKAHGAETRTIHGIRPILRGMGFLGNKHIPVYYQRGSVDQRLALLRGLMDTDGHCDTRGTATFVTKTEALADGVHELATGLGMKPTKRRYEAAHGVFWQVSFQAYQAMNPFAIERKAVRARPGERKARRFITACQPIASSPMSCIQVDRPDGLYLAGRAMVTTHNSTLITYSGIIQEIINDPEVTIGIFSHTKSISTAFSLQIRREFENNERFRAIYEDICWRRTSQAKTWTQAAWTVRRENNPKEATVEAHGLVDGQPTSRHFKHLVYDDVVTLESVSTPEQIKKTTQAWELSDNLGSKGDRRWHIGTRYHFGDTYGVIIERDIVKVRKYPATDNGKPDGNPVFLDAATWDRKKRTQRTTLAAQMLQNPLADKEQTFLPEWLTAYELRPATLNIYIMADPSRGAHRTSDRTAMAVIGIDAAGNKYLLDGFCHRMKLSEKWTNLRHLHRKWSQMPGVAFVKVGYERYGQISDDQYFEEQMKRDGYHFPLEELAWPREGGHSKRERVERLQPDFEYGSFFLPALVWVQGEGVCTWRYDETQQLVAYKRTERDSAGQVKPSALIRRLRERGQGYLEAKPIRRINEDGDPYDVTRVLMEEMSFFPFATRDDFVDACSRIYDMDPMSARPFEQMPELPATEDA